MEQEGKIVGELLGVAIVGLVLAWSREMAGAADPVRGMHGIEGPIEPNETKALKIVLLTTFQALVLGKTRELEKLTREFSDELDQVARSQCERAKSVE